MQLKPARWNAARHAVALACIVAATAATTLTAAPAAPASPAGSASWRIALAAPSGTNALDQRIRLAQEQVRAAARPVAELERLGWLFVTKARASHDDGYYVQAEHCARAMQMAEPDATGALLLLGHVAQARHQFHQAEDLARTLVRRRELAADHGLLGDALADQGRLDDAVVAYQRMVDLRPDLQSYARVAHVRWLKGDLGGAIEVARLAAAAGSPADPESAAWVFTRLGGYQLQSGATADARVSCRTALAFAPEHAPALFLAARLDLAGGNPDAALPLLEKAARRAPLPEYQWALADVLRETGREAEAIAVESTLHRTGRVLDPRTYSLFLATRAGTNAALAVALARAELRQRGDVFSHDALAWALAAADRPAEAWPDMERALAEGTGDARLSLHAAIVASQLGRNDAPARLARARECQALLLPSERRRLATVGPAEPNSRP